MNIIERETIGEAWQSAFNYIMQNGEKIRDNNQELIESMHIILIINAPDELDLLAQVQNNATRAWMRENFTEIKKMPALENSWSYGWRLYNFQGIDQINWVIEKLKKKPESKSATISMIQKAGEESYIPCVSLLDFKIRNNSLWLSVACRSLDFGKKAIHNFTNLAAIAKKVANALEIEKIKLIVYVISAHIYKQDWK
jgi:thymidylate synthase